MTIRLGLKFRKCNDLYFFDAFMSTLTDSVDEGPEESDCTGDPYECQCTRCRAWPIDIETDRKYDERKDTA